MSLLWAVIDAIWFFLPAMLPNTAAAIFGGGTPLDFGRMFRGKRVLGDGKTWRGLAVGICSGVVLGYMESVIAIPFGRGLSSVYTPSVSVLPTLIALSSGSMLGDIAGAFVKRRMGIERGASVPILDQYDFVAGALVVAFITSPAATGRYLLFGNALAGLAVVLLIIYPLHRLINYIGYRKGLKSVPW